MHAGGIESFAQEMTGIFRDHRLDRAGAVDIRNLSLDQAYDVQEKFLAGRLAQGESTVGYKVGCTSPAIRAQFGLSEPICGRLMLPRVYSDSVKLEIDDYVDCALEPELVFHIGSQLDGDNLETPHLRKAIAAVSPGIEVHNYRFWYGKPSSQELIASNGIHAALVVGRKYELPADLDLSEERATLFVNGEEKATGIGKEIMGGPFESLRWLLTHLRRCNQSLGAGDLVIPGSAAKLVNVSKGDAAEARFTNFGSCRASF
jgi:2-keto-4-pentenoate hydratase